MDIVCLDPLVHRCDYAISFDRFVAHGQQPKNEPLWSVKVPIYEMRFGKRTTSIAAATWPNSSIFTCLATKRITDRCKLLTLISAHYKIEL